MPQAQTTRSRSASRVRPDNEANPDMSLAGIGNYIFEKTIGQGNFAKVKLAKHKLTNREVAIKIIDKTTLDEKKLSKLHREVRIMKMLNHPNIVKLFEVIETKYTLFLVMEYVSGGELYDYLVAHGRLKEKDARAKFRQILSAVHYCHKKRVIHRDLKAENLLMDENLNIKIADFGFSNNYAPEGQLDTFCGSPPYAAPELFQGRKYTGPEVDIWSLGVILYVLCTGCLPFDGKDLKEMREIVCRGRYKVPFYLSEPCEKLLRKFLVRDPTKRASLDMLKDDPWLNEGYTEALIIDDLQPEHHESPDEEVISYMTEKFNVSRDQIIQNLSQQMYDDISAIYFLIVDQKAAGKWNPGQAQLQSQQSGFLGTPSLTSPTFINTSQPSNRNSMITYINDGTPSISPASPLARITTRDRSYSQGASSASAQRPRPVTWLSNEPPLPEGQIPKSGLSVTTEETQPQSGQQSPTKPTSAVAPGGSTSPTKGGILGMIRSLSHRMVDTPSSPPNQNGSQPNSPIESDKPRTLRFTFNSNTTSSKPPVDIVNEIVSVCQKLGIKYRMNGRFLVECTWNPREASNSQNAGGGGNLNVDQLKRALAEVMNTSEANIPGNRKSVGGSTGINNGSDSKMDGGMESNGNNSSTGETVQFDIEVCELPRLKNLHGLRFRRAGGSGTDYRDICGKILASINL